MMEAKKYIINEKRQAGGKNYKTYTWKEVLKWFSAPEDIDTIEELAIWCEQKDGIGFMYEVEEF